MAINVRSWRGFLAQVAKIRKSSDRPLLFRGQADADWKLKTTLERREAASRMDVATYFRLAGRVKPEFEAFSGRASGPIDIREILRLSGEYDSMSLALSGGEFPGASFLIDLRHHGFPSPLLDWTRSPYVASYFAFTDANKSKRRSIYVWEEPSTSFNTNDRPELRRLGQYVPAHRRHFTQQCDYTVCPIFSSAAGRWQFAPHAEAFAEQRSVHGPLWKFTIPSSQRLQVLGTLQEMNVNAYTLIGSDESLVEMLAFREVDLRAGH